MCFTYSPKRHHDFSSSKFKILHDHYFQVANVLHVQTLLLCLKGAQFRDVATLNLNVRRGTASAGGCDHHDTVPILRNALFKIHSTQLSLGIAFSLLNLNVLTIVT